MATQVARSQPQKGEWRSACPAFPSCREAVVYLVTQPVGGTGRARTLARGPLLFVFYLALIWYLLCAKHYLKDFTNRNSQSSQLCDVDTAIISHSTDEETESD